MKITCRQFSAEGNLAILFASIIPSPNHPTPWMTPSLINLPSRMLYHRCKRPSIQSLEVDKRSDLPTDKDTTAQLIVLSSQLGLMILVKVPPLQGLNPHFQPEKLSREGHQLSTISNLKLRPGKINSNCYSGRRQLIINRLQRGR